LSSLFHFGARRSEEKKITSDVVKNSAAEYIYIYRADHEVLNIQSPLDGNVSKRARQGDERDVSAPVRYNCPSLLGIISASVHFMRAFRRWVSLVFITCIRGNFVKCDKVHWLNALGALYTYILLCNVSRKVRFFSLNIDQSSSFIKKWHKCCTCTYTCTIVH